VVRDPALTARRAALYRSWRVRSCLQRVIAPAIEEQGSAGAEIEGVSISWRRPPLPGLAWSFGYRIKASVSLPGGTTQLAAYHPGFRPADEPATVPLYLDLLGFHLGRAEVTLVAVGAPTPVSEVLEGNVLRVLRDRAETNPP